MAEFRTPRGDPVWNAFTGELGVSPAQHPYSRIARSFIPRNLFNPIAGGVAAGAAGAFSDLAVPEQRKTLRGMKRRGAKLNPRRRKKNKSQAVMAVRRIIKSTKEVRHFYFSYQPAGTVLLGTDPDATISATLVPRIGGLTNIVQGDTISNRSGNSVFAQGLHITGNFLSTPVSGIEDVYVRMLVVQCKRDSVSDSIANNPYFQSGGTTPGAFLQRSKGTNFWFDYKTLFDKTYILNKKFGGMEPRNTFNEYIRIGGRVTYNANGTDALQNGIFVIAWSDTATAYLHFLSRFDFIDAS